MYDHSKPTPFCCLPTGLQAQIALCQQQAGRQRQELCRCCIPLSLLPQATANGWPSKATMLYDHLKQS